MVPQREIGHSRSWHTAAKLCSMLFGSIANSVCALCSLTLAKAV